MPSEVSDEIVLTHPALPPMVGFKESKFFFSSTAGVAGVAQVLGPLVPTDRYWWIQLADLSHNDPTSRKLSIRMQDTVPNDVAIFNEVGTRSTNELAAFSRPFLLPNDTRLLGVASALAATFVLTLRFFFLEFLHAEVNPSA